MLRLNDVETIRKSYFDSARVLESRLNFLHHDNKTNVDDIKHFHNYDFTLLFKVIKAEKVAHKKKSFYSLLVTGYLHENPEDLIKIFIVNPDSYLLGKIGDDSLLVLIQGVKYKMYRKEELAFFTLNTTSYQFIPRESPTAHFLNYWQGRKSLESYKSPTKGLEREYLGPYEIDLRAWTSRDGTILLENVLRTKEDCIMFEGVVSSVNAVDSKGNMDKEEIEVYVKDLNQVDTIKVYVEYRPMERDQVLDYFRLNKVIQFKALYRKLNHHLEFFFKTYFNRKYLSIERHEPEFLEKLKSNQEHHLHKMNVTRLATISQNTIRRNVIKIEAHLLHVVFVKFEFNKKDKDEENPILHAHSFCKVGDGTSLAFLDLYDDQVIDFYGLSPPLVNKIREYVFFNGAIDVSQSELEKSKDKVLHELYIHLTTKFHEKLVCGTLYCDHSKDMKKEDAMEEESTLNKDLFPELRSTTSSTNRYVNVNGSVYYESKDARLRGKGSPSNPRSNHFKLIPCLRVKNVLDLNYQKAGWTLLDELFYIK